MQINHKLKDYDYLLIIIHKKITEKVTFLLQTCRSEHLTRVSDFIYLLADKDQPIILKKNKASFALKILKERFQ